MTTEQTICVAAEANEILREFPSQRPVPFTRQLARLGAFLFGLPLRSLVRVYQVRAISFPFAWKGSMNNYVTCPCQYCDERIEFDAESFQPEQSIPCPHCGLDTVLFVPQPPAEKKAKTLKIRVPKIHLNRTFYCVCGVAVLMLLIVAAAIQGGEPQKMDIRETATEMSLLIISNSLVAPSTAKFSDISYDSKPDGVVFVTGQVDAQNSFGAMLRQSWMCILTNENSHKMEYLGFTIGDQTVMNPDFEAKSSQ